MSWADVRHLLGVVRDVLALLYTPVMTVLAVGLTCSFMFGPWSPASETLRLTALGFTLGGYVVLQGLGGLWLQRRAVNRLRVEGPGDSALEIEAGQEGPDPR